MLLSTPLEPARHATAASLVVSFLSVAHASPTAHNSSQGIAEMAPSSYGNDTQALTGLPPCDALLSAGLSHAVHLPSSPIYQDLVEVHWALNTRRAPWCFVRPNSVEEIIKTLAALGSTSEGATVDSINGAGDWHIAVRSGGHGSDYSNNIEDGVTIDLSHLDETTYDATKNLASVGTGARWESVYEELLKHDVQVTGGRNGVVGVGGFLLGGGNSWYSAKTGFGCDSIINAEVVLASGEVINANATANADLWKALKGGGSNFGIVTRFDLEAYPAMNLSMTSRTVGLEQTEALVDAFVGFTDLDQSFHDNALLGFLSYSPKASRSTVMFTEVNTVGDGNSTAFDSFRRLSTLTPATQHSVSIVDSAYTPDSPATKNAGSLITFANDPRVMRFAIEQHEALVADLKTSLGPDHFTTVVDFQPIPAYFSEISIQKGGNMLGLERGSRNKILFVAGVTLLTPESRSQLQYLRVYQQINAMVERVDAYAKSLGSDEEFIYLNYAHSNQDALGSYGEANVEFIRKVAKKYDPHGFFQSRVPGGFKISRVL